MVRSITDNLLVIVSSKIFSIHYWHIIVSIYFIVLIIVCISDIHTFIILTGIYKILIGIHKR